VRVKILALILTAFLLVWAGMAAQTGSSKKSAAPKVAPKKSVTTAKKSVPAPKKSAATTKTGKHYTAPKNSYANKSYANSRKASRPAAPRYYGQNEPTQDRYREIQQALIQRGYMQTEASGRWDAGSMDALRRFQQDQNLEASGKLDSLSLIALGLGPKRTASAQARPQ
jgi:hypothetical protein